MKPIYKKIIKIAAVVVGGFFILYLALIGPELWRSYKWQKAVDNYEEAMRKPYKEDIYGGKTPEETWSMFLDALKKGDIDLASKYFAVEKQEEMKEKFQEILTGGNLENSLENFSTFEIEDKIKDNRAYYHIKMPFKGALNGFIFSPVNFYLNPYTKIWKILVL